MSTDRPRKLDDSDDSLDRLLASAAWPAPTEAQVERLRRRWFLLRRGRPNRGAAPWAVAALAAGLLVATAAAGWRWLGNPPLRLAPNRRANQAAVDATANASRNGPLSRSSVRPDRQRFDLPISSSPSLALTSYEQVAAMAVLRRREGAKRTMAPPAFDEQPLAEALAALAAAAEAEVAKSEDRTDAISQPLAWRASAASAAASLRRRTEQYEPALWIVLRDRRTAMHVRRLAAARLLSQLATPRSQFVLEQLACVADFHAAAIVGLARVAGDERRAELLAAERQPELQRLLLAALLESGDAATVERFLHCVNDPAWRPLALAAARDATRPPVELLFGYLADPHVALREAAAQTLGHIADPTVPSRLARHVVENISRREALVGLLSSPSLESASYVRRAKQDLQLMATVQSVETELFSMDFPRR